MAVSDTEHPQHDGPDSEIGAPDELPGEFAALLADPTMWDEPGGDLGERIVGAVRSESAVQDPEPDTSIAGATSGKRRSWWRPALLGAAAAVVFLFGGIVVLSALSGVDDRETFSSELTATGVLANVSGDVDIAVYDSGLRIDLDAPTLPRRDNGKFYEGWLKTFDGDLIPVGTFHEGDGVIMWAGVGFDQVEAFTITLEEAAQGQDPGQSSSGEIVLRALINGG